MTMLDKLQRKFGRFALPNVTVSLICCQVVVYVLAGLGNQALADRLTLIPQLVLQGEVWRLFSFVFVVLQGVSPIWAFFFWYLFYLMGTTLEQSWGAFRYNVYLLIGWTTTVAATFVAGWITPGVAASPEFLQASVFLAFAYLYPDFQLMLFFLLPVKIKWLALLQCLGYGLALLTGGWLSRMLVIASIANFLVFFGRDLVRRMRTGHRRMVDRADRIKQQEIPRHRCLVCGVTNKSDPQMDFRYCSKCAGGCCYCEDHLHRHQHVTGDPDPAV